MNKLKDTLLEQYYVEIEETTEMVSHKIFNITEELSEEDIFHLRIEYFAQTPLNEQVLLKNFEQRKEEVLQYLKKRISTTSNIILKAKYNNFVFILTKNNSFCQEAIEYYQEVLKNAFTNTQNENYEFTIEDTLEKIVELSIKIRYKISELKTQVTSYLKNSSIGDKLKTRLFLFIKEKNLFTAKESIEFPSFFITLANTTSDENWIKHNLNLALFYAQKNQNQQQIQFIYELLGDNECKNILPEDEHNLAIPHLNENTYEKIIDYYKKAKCEDKLKHIWNLHSKNKKNKRTIPIKINTSLPNDFFIELNSRLEAISNLRIIDIVSNLILCQHFLFMPNSYFDKFRKNKSFCEEYFTFEQIDANFNHKKVDSNDNDKFLIYQNIMNININFISRFLLCCIEKKKLSYQKLYTILEKYTSFGIKWQVILGEQIIASCSWLSMIDIGIKSFFDQLKKLQKEKIPDWRACVDILVPKFEGILRHILEHNGANLTELNTGNTSYILLEKMLRLEKEDIKEAFYKSFDDDDLNFFQYVFSSKAQCLNIRNNVAHCFYLPQQYNFGMAIMVLLGILRLAKFVPINPQEKE